RQFLNDLKDGDAVEETYLLTDKQIRANRNANLYLLAELRDRSASMNGLMWNVTEDRVAEYDAGDFVRVRGKVQMFQRNLQMILTGVEKGNAATLDPADFEEQPHKDVDQLFMRLRDILLSIDDPQLRMLMECFLIDESLMQQFVQSPV